MSLVERGKISKTSLTLSFPLKTTYRWSLLQSFAFAFIFNYPPHIYFYIQRHFYISLSTEEPELLSRLSIHIYILQSIHIDTYIYPIYTLIFFFLIFSFCHSLFFSFVLFSRANSDSIDMDGIFVEATHSVKYHDVFPLPSCLSTLFLPHSYENLCSECFLS